MHFIFILGPPAVGKMTVGKEISELTGFPLFHNHMAIEPVLEIFEFDSPPFERIVRAFREHVFREVAASDLPGFITTGVWNLDDPRDRAFVDEICAPFRERGAEVRFVELHATLEERLRRNRTEPRLSEKPSKRDVEASEARILGHEESGRRFNTDGDFFYPDEHVKVDTTELTPLETAKRILDEIGLSDQVDGG